MADTFVGNPRELLVNSSKNEIQPGLDEDRAVAEARAVLGQVQAAIAASSPKAAQKLLAELRGMQVPMNSQVAAVISSANGLAPVIDALLIQEEQVDAEFDTTEPTPVFSKRHVQQHIFRLAAPGTQEFFDHQLQGDSHKGVGIRVEKDSAGKDVVVKGKEEKLDGEEVRESFTRMTFHGLRKGERAEISKQHGYRDDLTPQEAEKMRDSLLRMEKFRAARIMEGPGTDEEKDAKLKAMHKKFEAARERLEDALDAEKKEKAAPEVLKGAAKNLKENRREAFRESVEKVRNEEVMNQKDVGVTAGKGMDVSTNTPPLPTPGGRRNEVVEGMGGR